MNEIDLTNDETLFSINGGTLQVGGANANAPPVRDFGWRPTPAGVRPAVAGQPFGADNEQPVIKGDKVFLWEFVKAANGGKLCPFNWQLTGSCVNGGFYNAFRVVQAVQCVTRPEAAAFVEPFTLAVYGQSRRDAFGWTQEGEGSTGPAMARAAAEMGVIPFDDPAVPRAQRCGPAVVFTRSEELRWSSVLNHPSDLKARSKPYTLKYTEVQTADQATAELRKGRPLTWAGDWGGRSKGVVKGSQFPVLTMPRYEKWQHQQAVLGYWKHPELGELWYVLNQWYSPSPGMQVEYIRIGGNTFINRITTPGPAIPMHGESRQGEPPGGYWISRADMQYQCQTGEVFSLHGLHGYDGRALNFGMI